MRQKALWVVVIVVVSLMMIPFGTVQAQPPIPDDPTWGEIDLGAITEIDLTALPLVPEIGAYAQAVYQAGIEQGNNPHTFVKVGDCMTDNDYFLIPIGEGNYDLGEYADLQATIEYFITDDLNSFARVSQASLGGFNTSSILESMWANPEFCEAGESPLACEFRHMTPSIALIMFGTNDVQYLPAEQFDYFMRAIVIETLKNGTLPILSTFPHRPEFPEESILYNQIVAHIAQDYELPLINLWLALEDLPNQGVDPVETTHMTTPVESAQVCYFIGENLEAGFTVRNLLTLQTLDAVLATEGE
ncbi:MAG: SGNH/GDSL hydrolase family protein [Anaerolineae bacterium]|nr:SGNH/GDSL hydrolase family protein [Anaerolineae bacterium]